MVARQGTLWGHVILSRILVIPFRLPVFASGGILSNDGLELIQRSLPFTKFTSDLHYSSDEDLGHRADFLFVAKKSGEEPINIVVVVSRSEHINDRRNECGNPCNRYFRCFDAIESCRVNLGENGVGLAFHGHGAIS